MNQSDKTYPTAAPEVEKLLKLDGKSQAEMRAHTTGPAPANLPIIDASGGDMTEYGEQPANVPATREEQEIVHAAHQEKEEADKSENESEDSPKDAPKGSEAKKKSRSDDEAELEKRMADNTGNALWNVAKKISPYVAVFAIGLGLYYFYFNDWTPTSLFKQDTTEETRESRVDAQALAVLKQEESASYNLWISQFFFDVTDPNIIDMDTDVSGNGLTNFEKYLFNLNPKVYDTLGNGLADGQAIVNGINPWTGKNLTDNQKKLVELYVDPQLVSDRLAAAQADQDNKLFAAFATPTSPYYPGGQQPPAPAAVPSNTAPIPTQPATDLRGLGNNGQVAGATRNDPAPAPMVAPNTGVSNGPAVINQSIPGRLEIPTYKIDVPIIWTQQVKDFDRDLKKGLVHFPGTPFPGETGTSYISGHSSGRAFDSNPYKNVFARLGSMSNGTRFVITLTLLNGQQVKYHYVIEGKGEYQADDPRQFLQTADQVVALSTCWPVGTNARRMVQYGRLTRVEK